MSRIQVLVIVAWSCSDSTSFSEGGADNPFATHSKPAQKLKLSMQEALFTIVDQPQLSAEQERFLSVIRNRPTTADVHIARMANAPAALLEKGRAVVLTVSPSKQFIAVGEKVTRRRPRDISWAGPLQNGLGWIQLVLTDKGVTGWLRKDSLLFKFEPLGGDMQALIHIDRSIKFSDQPTGYPSGALIDTASVQTRNTMALDGETSSVTISSTNSGPADIGLLVVYTQAAANAVNDINGLIQTAIDETNQSYSNSNIYASVYLAHSAQVNYDETGRTHPQHVQFLQGTSDGEMDNVHNLRSQHLADVVVLIVNDIDAGGTGGYASAILASASTAFVSVHQGFATGDFAFGHEIGHLQGARHNDDPNTSPFPYGHGFNDPNRMWQTVMANPGSCLACNRVQYWSNPYVDHPTTGQAMGTEADNNNARVLNETKYDIRDFETLPAPQNLAITNLSSYGDHPQLTWSDVPEADGYYVYRCITDDSHYDPSCFHRAFGPITIGGSGWEWIDPQVTIDQYGTSCDERAIYRVTSQNITGEATAPSEPRVCIDTPY